MQKFLLLLALLTLASCRSTPPAPLPPLPQAALEKATVASDSVSIMSFNAENLFDAEHDADKDDWAYLPASRKGEADAKKACREIKNKFYRKQCRNLDWNEEVVAAKLRNVAEVVSQVNGGHGADVVVLVEVENEKILKRLAEQMPQAAYVTQVLIEGPDPRGIDVAVLSRLALDGTPVLHKVNWDFIRRDDRVREADLRGMLEVPLKLPNGERLTVLANHFPAQGNPREYRIRQTRFLKNFMQGRGGDLVIAAGDFNITAEEDRDTGLFRRELAEAGDVSHLIGCRSCEGTHNYRGSWSFLDALIFSKSLSAAKTAGWSVDPESIEVPRAVANHRDDDGRPVRFDEEERTGASDHFPIFARIKLKKAAKPTR